jgi:hypothetical protein
MRFITSYLRKRKTEKRNLRNINHSIECHLKKQHFTCKALNSAQSLVNTTKQRAQEVVVSLTTYSKRIHDVHLVIESLGEQTYLADRIILWLDEEEYTIDTLPKMLMKQIERGLEVRFCKNLRSYKKLIPTLNLYPEADIITVDDDFIYPYDLIELLTRGKEDNPNAIIGMRAHEIKHTSSEIAPYREWGYEVSHSRNGPLTFLTTGAGTLFPASILHPEICKYDNFLSICPDADDVWINFMCIHYGIERAKISDDRPFHSRFFEIENGQDIALNKSNVHQEQNDAQVQAVIKRYQIAL